MTTMVFTDGATRNNGASDAIGGIGVFWGDDHPDNVSECFTREQLGKQITNNLMELTAIQRAFHIFRKNSSGGGRKLILYTDSMYAVKAITEWARVWERNGWRLKSGKDVQHSDLVRRIYEDFSMMNVEIRHCFSHQPKRDDPVWHGNHQADMLASTACFR